MLFRQSSMSMLHQRLKWGASHSLIGSQADGGKHKPKIDPVCRNQRRIDVVLVSIIVEYAAKSLVICRQASRG